MVRENLKNILFFMLIAIFLSLFFTQSVGADGGVLIPDFEGVVYLPEQKAAILWDGTNETMIISTKISSDNFSDMAWIIPIPSNSTPEVNEGDIEIFYEIALDFGEWGGGDYYFPIESCLISFFIFAIGVLGLILLLLKRKIKLFIPLLLFSIILIIISLIIGFYVIMDYMVIGAGDEVYDVEIIEIKKVDIYDVAVLKATNATNLVDWLNNNDFVVPLSAIPVLQDYCNQSDFYFVVNKINLTNMYTTPEEIQNATDDLQDGVATPLQITFQPEQPFYPMKMSSINSGDTSVHVYFISNCTVMDESDYLIPQETRYAFHGPIIPSYNVGDVITWLRYEGSTKDLIGDSYFFLMG